MLNYLLDLVPDAVDWEDKQGDTPLILGKQARACGRCRQSVADGGAMMSSRLTSECVCDGAVVAGGAGRLPVVELLLQRGAKVEQGRHAKALHHAAAHEDVEVRTHATLKQAAVHIWAVSRVCINRMIMWAQFLLCLCVMAGASSAAGEGCQRNGGQRYRHGSALGRGAWRTAMRAGTKSLPFGLLRLQCRPGDGPLTGFPRS